jgi:UDPglucose 6-dehydrogenase
MSKKIGLLGKGTVGKAVYEGLTHLGHQMSFFDPAYAGSKIEDVLDTEVVFLCVPTNQAENGDCDTSIVESVVEELSRLRYRGLVAIKSTVVPGTSDRLSQQYPDLKICSVPEFLRAKTALADFMYHHDLLIIGSHREEDFDIIEQIHGNLPQNVARVKPAEAEVVKYFNNVNHSVQIIFANIAFDVCKALGVDYNNVYNAIIKRECFNPAYLMCNDNLRGFGGHCLPKDTSAWANLVKKLGLNYTMIDAVQNDNKDLKK